MTIFCSSMRKAHDLLPDCLVAQNTTVGSLNGLLTLGKSGLLLVSCWPDSLQLQSSHRTFGDRGALLQVLEDQLAAGSPDLLHSVGLGVVGQPTSVRNSLNPH